MLLLSHMPTLGECSFITLANVTILIFLWLDFRTLISSFIYFIICNQYKPKVVLLH